MKLRYLPAKSFPPYVFVPGIHPHPKKSGGYMEGVGDPTTEPLDIEKPFENQFLRYSLDLFNHGYYWESHVYFEALWNAHNREGVIADFLKAMIKLGAAGVKMQLGQDENFKDHLVRARELFDKVRLENGFFLGFDITQIISQIDDGLACNQMIFEIYPEWN